MKKLMMAAILLVAAACSGVTAREEVLMRDMELAWPNVAENVKRGSAEDQTAVLSAVSLALQSRDRYELAKVPVMSLLDLASIGVQKRVEAKEIGPGVAASLLERIRNFREAYLLAVSR